MTDDPIVDEIRRFRDEYAAKFDYDLSAMVRDLKRQEVVSGTRTVHRPPQRISPAAPVGPLQSMNDAARASH